MVFQHTSVVHTPLHDVFEWHSRPGALTRLTPPWHPVRAATESGSLRDGTAVLALPGGLRFWVAAHQPWGYNPPRRFVDELVSSPLAPLVRWLHSHEFTPETESATRVTDRVDTSVPHALLRAMFTYRHAQLTEDLAAQHRSHQWHAEPLTVAITGSGGLIGTALTTFLTTSGHHVIRLVRRTARHSDERQWNPESPAPDLLDGVDALVHLAGEPLIGTFSASHRQAIRDSRVGPTRKLAELLASAATGPGVFVSASAVGYYGADNGEEILTEDSPRGDGFLAEVVADWEAATQPAAAAGVRCVQVRTGLAQSPRGGLLGLLSPIFAAGLGGRIGDGQQWMPWIGIDDLTDIYVRAILDTELSGPVNAVAPRPVRNETYAATLAQVLRRPAALPVPAFAPRLVLGREGSRELAFANQRVQPARLTQAGHHFRHPQLDEALGHLFGRPQAAPSLRS